jgi:hypothetical protein
VPHARERAQLANELTRARRRWPDDDARTTYETFSARLASLRNALATAGIDRATLRGL